jgi:YVTN family beta-propeller protein
MAAEIGVASPALNLSVLGPLDVARSGRPVRLGGLRQRAVLARLICSVGRVVTNDQLADAVWGDSVPPGYLSTLQTYVFHLREALEPDRSPGTPATVLRTADGGYRLDLTEATLDAARFGDLVSEAQARLAAGDSAGAADGLNAAIALWRDEVLADLRDFEFVGPYADRLDALLADAQEALLDAELALGHHVKVVDAATALIATHAHRERFHAQRMLALYRCGRQSEALSAYTALRRELVDDLGIEPSPDVQELHQRILDQDPALDWQPPTAAETSVDPARRETRVRVARPRPRRRTTLLAAAVAVALLGGTLFAVASLAGGGRRTAAPDSAVEIGSKGKIGASIPVGQPPGGIAATVTDVWITNPENSSLTRIDTRTKRRVAEIPVANAPVAITAYQGDIWVVDNAVGEIQEISPATNTAVQSIAVGHDPSALAGGLGYVWVADQGDGTVTRVDPTGKVAPRTIPVGGEPDGVAVGDNAVWVANRFDNTVSRIDPTSLATSTIGVGVGPQGIAVTTTAVWVADSLDLTVARIDLVHGDAVTKVETGDSPTGVVEFRGAVWASNAGDATISRLEESSGRVTRTFYFGSSPGDLAAAGSTLWVSSKAFASTAHRGGTLTVATVVPDDGMASIDPVFAYDSDIYDGMSEVYDTLVAVRKSTGLTGLDLVPDLAEQLPTPTDGGLTYLFQLRPSITYSDGEPLRASDFRRGIERTLLVDPDYGDGYFDDIVGATECETQPARCNLSAGIVTDDEAGTVTFHLVKPDPNLLGALSITGFSTPTPASTPMTRDVGSMPVPGTGPYVISQFTPQKSVTLSRNPHFVRWSSAAQPAGYPDQIVWKGYSTQQAAVAAVGAGNGADVVYINRNADVAQLLESYPGQLLRTQSFGDHFLVLNSRVPPFNNPLARQAVAEALTADPTEAPLDHGTPTCTLVPAGFPGDPTTCAYVENRTTAAATVRSSGTYGATVHVYFENSAPFAQIGAYITNVLDQIGYHAELTLEANYRAALYDPKARPVNAEGLGWLPDFPTESQFWIDASCDPTAFLHNLGVCNPEVDASAATAFAAEGTDSSQAQLDWQHTYSLMDADARLIPLDTPGAQDVLVSPRVGNAEVTTGVVGLALLDQFWVQ